MVKKKPWDRDSRKLLIDSLLLSAARAINRDESLREERESERVRETHLGFSCLIPT